MTPRIRLVHWNAQEAASLLRSLRGAGYTPEYDEKTDSRVLRQLRNSPPDAIVIDLSRLPSHGSELATAVRCSPATRQIPIVFVGGVAEKVEAVRLRFPDATYASPPQLRAALGRAIDQPPKTLGVPPPMMGRYSGRSTADKLGIKERCAVALVDPPRDYPRVIGGVPEGVRFEEQAGQPCDITLWFVSDPDAYRGALSRMRALAGSTKLWVLWPKGKTVTQKLIRGGAVEVGLVDYKICSVNDTWSAMALARRRLGKRLGD